MADAVALGSDFKIYNAEFQTGVMERVAQNLDAFNEKSRNAIRLVTKALKGEYLKEAFFKPDSSDFTRRDVDSFADVDTLKPTQDEFISVKLNRRFGPYAFTGDSIRKIQISNRALSLLLGRRYGIRKLESQLNSGIIAVEAAIEGQTDLNYDATGESTATLTQEHLVSGLAKMGDRQNRIICWVMHSKPWADLMKNTMTTDAFAFQIGDIAVNRGTIPTLGRPTIVTDSSALWDLNGTATDTYNVLGLVEDAVVITESEEDTIESDKSLGAEQIIYLVQGECAFTVGVKGMKWDITNGGANPTDSALGTTTNWDAAATDDKDKAGVRIKVQ